MSKIPKKIDDLEKLLETNRIFRQRSVDIGKINKTDALDRGFSGPCLRASGVEWDLRRNQPYDCYSDLEFKIPIGTNGDCFERFLVRIEEMRQSIIIIIAMFKKYLMEMYFRGSKESYHLKETKMKSSMESLINHFKLFTEGFHVPEGETYTCVLRHQKENLEFF